ncbi:type VI secretion system Vgr family protein [Aureimonas leprariae]|uniref:Type VI secretion system tip protein VgrG n=1 Tax=Plantimonas leprariae TaxID=2615207 RepID=A0A7V7PLS9_9HYPH|nr:type VI secretion system tip protein TssI/VgrG [Aureimonas leprariae]KAB0677367.1 type VI secretion system tip protein VgrG [Aureimonas leprariae]
MDDAFSAIDLVQAERLLRIETPLGADVLLLERFAGREQVNGLFEFRAVVRAKRADVTPQDLVGKLVDVSLDLGQGGRESAEGRRSWNALVTDLVEEPRLKEGLRQYMLTLRPELWLLSQRSDCRIWQNRTSLEVAETLLSEHGLRRPDTGGVSAPVRPQEYSIQWNETDLDYLLRRLEEDGLFYWVRHAAGAQTVAIADSSTAWDKGHDGGEGQVRYSEGSTDRDHLSEWRRRFSFVPGKRAGRDWNFETPATVPGGEAPSLVNLPRNGAYELYEYPARALDASTNEAASKLRMQATEADHERIRGQSTVRTLAPGAKLKPYDVAHPENGFETAVALLVEHEAEDTSYETSEGEPVYRNRVEALPARTPFTPHRKTRRPRIEGSQIALVAGPGGEEIHTDQYGRIKLWFPWDRRARKDGTDTKWVRVGQPWAGGTWGAQVIPRIGMEAIVSFQDGDPDKPIVTALVPNPDKSVPYDLPANKTRMTFRSDTHKGSGFNEFSMEDDNGRENFFQHAQKDMTTRVLNTQTSRVDSHAVQSVGANRSVEVGGNQKHEVGGSMNLTVGGTGPQAMALMAQVSGLAGQTAGLLQQAGQIGGGNMAAIGQMAMSIAGSAMGFFGGGGLQSRQGVVSGPSPRSDAGTALSQAGQGMGDAAASLFSLPGTLTNVVGSFQSDTVGIARTEQIGVSKITNVGKTSLENVGQFKKVIVGEEFVIECGASKLIMRKDGTVIILGSNFNFTASGPAQMNGVVVDLNKPGGPQEVSSTSADSTAKG